MSSTVKSAERALDVLTFLSTRAAPVPAMVVARECGIPKSSAYHLLNAMRARNFVLYHEEGTWGLGGGALELSSTAMQTKPLERISRPVLRSLALSMRQRAHVAVLLGGEVLYVAKEPTGAVGAQMDPAVGVHLPAHLTAVGTAMLMCLPGRQVRALYPHGRRLPQLTSRGPADLTELGMVLNRWRERGYAVEHGQVFEGMSCVAAPVRDHTGAATAAIGVTVVSEHHTQQSLERLGVQLRAAAQQLARARGYRPSALAPQAGTAQPPASTVPARRYGS
jgi:DNA-binding IclR family transcriptional regulator